MGDKSEEQLKWEQQYRDATLTQDPFGNVWFGNPLTPQPAYPGQHMPPPYVWSPPPAFYHNPQDPFELVPIVPPPQYYYGIPQDYQAPPYAPPVTPMLPMVPPPPGYSGEYNGGYFFDPGYNAQPTVDYAPRAEVTADFSDSDHKTTDLPYNGDHIAVTHLNCFSNFIERIDGLEKYPNMLRLTLRENCLKTLHGIDKAPYLRWLDVSNNYLSDFSGMGSFPNLEWLDATNNNVTNFFGLSFAPNLTWLNCHYNHVSDVSGLEKYYNLRWVDLSHSDLRHVRGLENCTNLQEINLCNNYLDDVKSIEALAQMPHLFRLGMYRHNLSKDQVEQIVSTFKKFKPQCEVITTLEEANNIGMNVFFAGESQNCCSLL